jgi:DNA-directed RNA polymerase omega subunit
VIHLPGRLGIDQPGVDHLLEHTASRFELVNAASRRARQITVFRLGLDEGFLNHVGPVVTPRWEREPALSIALREIGEGLLDVQRW